MLTNDHMLALLAEIAELRIRAHNAEFQLTAANTKLNELTKEVNGSLDISQPPSN